MLYTWNYSTSVLNNEMLFTRFYYLRHYYYVDNKWLQIEKYRNSISILYHKNIRYISIYISNNDQKIKKY